MGRQDDVIHAEQRVVVADRFGLQGGIWSAVSGLNDNFGALGYLIIGVFVVTITATMTDTKVMVML